MSALEPDDPRSVGEYRLLGRLGAGGMGRVFLGRSPGGRLVAVKVVHAELLRRPEFRDRFRREVQAARMVSGAFTAPVVDADPDAPLPWLVTSYIAGPSLEQAVAERGPFDPQAVLTLAAGLAEALVSIHAAHLVHRDLKPSNVLLAEDGPRVIDFGIVRSVDADSLTGSGHMAGSPGFMSPEQVNGDEVTWASDVFCLGAVLAFAATGTNPFGAGPTPALLYRVVHNAPDVAAVADPALRSLIADCLAKDPAHRPAPREILARIGPLGGESATALPHAQQWTPAARPTRADAVPTRIVPPVAAPPAHQHTPRRHRTCAGVPAGARTGGRTPDGDRGRRPPEPTGLPVLRRRRARRPRRGDRVLAQPPGGPGPGGGFRARAVALVRALPAPGPGRTLAPRRGLRPGRAGHRGRPRRHRDRRRLAGRRGRRRLRRDRQPDRDRRPGAPDRRGPQFHRRRLGPPLRRAGRLRHRRQPGQRRRQRLLSPVLQRGPGLGLRPARSARRRPDRSRRARLDPPDRRLRRPGPQAAPVRQRRPGGGRRGHRPRARHRRLHDRPGLLRRAAPGLLPRRHPRRTGLRPGTRSGAGRAARATRLTATHQRSAGQQLGRSC
ncbi:putative serine/threonine protein kinase [Streptomyces lividans 1326]|uniref:non-specific serine/threonine protein kinase n=2 Tax=Streptomyces TaxID=1883 RepID=A0A7U9DSW1_STRLI|nr:putative serine/threonine protein kinase [Streptomyces lividans 1326]